MFYRGYSSWVSGVVWSPDGTRIASYAESTVQVWDASTASTLFTYQGQSNEILVSIAWSPNGKYIAFGGGDRSTNTFPIQVVNAMTGDHIFTYNGHSNYVFAIAWAPDDRRIASGSDDATVQVWEAI